MLWAHRRAWSATNAPSFLRHGVLDRFDQLTDLKGLAQKGNATGLERLLAHAVMKMTGSMDPEPLSRRRNSMPDIPPRWMSRRRQST